MMRTDILPYMTAPVRVAPAAQPVQQPGMPASQLTVQSPQSSTFSQFLAGAHNPFSSPESNLMNRLRQLRGL